MKNVLTHTQSIRKYCSRDFSNGGHEVEREKKIFRYKLQWMFIHLRCRENKLTIPYKQMLCYSMTNVNMMICL